MLTDTPALRWRSASPRGKKSEPPTPPPPLAVELIAAGIIDGRTFIELTFNQPIDIAQIQAYDIFVDDPHV